MTELCAPAICVSCPHTDATSLCRDPEILFLKEHTPHLFELRLDRMADLDATALRALMAWLGPRRVVLTCRSKNEGGQHGPHAAMTQVARPGLLDSGAELGPLYLDLELASLRCDPDTFLRLQRFRRGGARLILSVHARAPVSDAWLREKRRMADCLGADVTKIVLTDASLQAPFQALRLAQEATKTKTPLLTFATGMTGQLSRMLSDLGDAPPPLVFASLHTRPSVAPGQLDWKTMERAYRVARPARIYGIVGSPVAHSLSPAWHQQAFALHHDQARYVFCEVSRGALPEFLALAKNTFSGFSVTMPHKEDAAAQASQCTPGVLRTSVANTLRLDAGGLYSAENTDAPAVKGWLRQALLSGSDPPRVLVVGAGGFAVSVIEAAASLGARLFLCGRNFSRLGQLAKRYDATILDAASVPKTGLDIIVNATPLGMPGPLREQFCLPLEGLGRDIILFDGVYQGGALTPWLCEGQRLGHRVVSGLSLFCEQANLQRKFWGFTSIANAQSLHWVQKGLASSVEGTFQNSMDARPGPVGTQLF